MVILFIILILFVALAAIYIYRINKDHKEIPTEVSDDCCGAHSVCERDTLLSNSDHIIYFDDEELDSLAGIAVNEMSEHDLKLIEDVFFTLKEQDVAGWLRSVQLRNIELPEFIRDEALLIVSERRTALLDAH